MKHKLDAIVSRVRQNYRHHQRVWHIGAGLLFIAICGIGTFVLSRTSDSGVSRVSPDVEVALNQQVETQTMPSPLSGVEVPVNEAERPVTAIVIENSPEARPQSSLHEAGIVFESIAEGGITRFLAFYQEGQPDIIGPVRSLRPYFIDWVLPFDASIAHVGGSAQALQEARDLGINDLDEFANANSFYRASDRLAPHNLYTNFDLLDELNKRLGYTGSDFQGWARKTESPLNTPTASTINVDISSFTYNTKYVYDSSSNSYQRATADAADRDRETNTQIAPKVVVVMEAPSSIDPDGRYQYDLIGEGKVTVFQDGGHTVGTWAKSSRENQFSFTDDDGDEIAFNPGQTWVVAISPEQEVRFAP